MIKLWLDDVRIPPDDWTWCKTASLDHDLGVCESCYELGDQAVDVRICAESCAHACHETGSDLVRWMAEHDAWPMTKPRVHSANPVGAAYMRGVIERYWSPPRAV